MKPSSSSSTGPDERRTCAGVPVAARAGATGRCAAEAGVVVVQVAQGAARARGAGFSVEAPAGEAASSDGRTSAASLKSRRAFG